LSSKRLEILKETRPGLSRVAVLWDATPDLVGDPYRRRSTEEASRSLGLKLAMLAVRGANDLPGAFDAARNAHAEALAVLPSAMLPQYRTSVVELAAKHRLPAIYHHRQFTDAGGLMAYGPNYADLFRRAAYFVDKLLKGAKPGDLPIEQPTKFEFVINLKTAKALGLTIPPSLLLRADHVIE
jgi:putative ABC transport system substrate-binding protein